jgi:hypothetical protein
MKFLTRFFHRGASQTMHQTHHPGVDTGGKPGAASDINDEPATGASPATCAESDDAAQSDTPGEVPDKHMTVLKALQSEMPGLVGELIAKGGDIQQRDDYGSMAIHYAAALGYLDVLKSLLRAGADPWTRNHEGQTPLVYAMDHRQWEAAKLLWQSRSQSMRIESQTTVFQQLVEELCAIAVYSPWEPGKGESGFYQKDYVHHPRAVEIGVKLNEQGGINRMREAALVVQETLGQRTVRNLECAWDGIGDWMM